MSNRMIIRHGVPTKYDQAPFGTSCKIPKVNSEGFDLWMQYSTDELNPRWEFMGFFNDDALDSHICDRIISTEDNTL